MIYDVRSTAADPAKRKIHDVRWHSLPEARCRHPTREQKRGRNARKFSTFQALFSNDLGGLGVDFWYRAHPQRPLGTQSGARIYFLMIFIDFRVSLGRPWGTLGLHFGPWIEPVWQWREKNTVTRSIAWLKRFPTAVLDRFGTARDLDIIDFSL